MPDAGYRWWLNWSLVLPVLALVAAVGTQGLGAWRETPRARGPHLANLIATSVPGWLSRELPLGPNEFVAGEVEKTLNYDEVFYREYTRGEENFAVYTAYWGAGKMPTRLVASHTPDRCWTENGMRCVEMIFKQATVVDGQPQQPAEWRVFETAAGGRQIYVLYWHLVDGLVYDYGNRFNAVPSVQLWLKDAAQQLLRGSREQYFVRLTSTAPLESLRDDPGFVAILRGLSRLGLAIPASSLPPVSTP
jgi:hypothetical protein